MNLAIKDIRHNLGRFVLTAIGIGMLLMIVMGMGGIYRGISDDATLLIDNIGADIWIVQHNTRGPFAELSRIPQNLVYRAMVIPGVATARSFVQHTIQRQNNIGKQLRMTIVGLDWPIDKGEWVVLESGRILNQNHYEMIADTSLGLNLGEKIKLGKNTYTVVGITSSMISSGGDGIGFFTIQDALDIQLDKTGEAVRLDRVSRSNRVKKNDLGLKQPNLIELASQKSSQLPGLARPEISSVILKLKPGANLKQVENIIEGWKDVSIFTSNGERQLLLKGTVEKVRKQIGLFRILLTIISAIIMALILYTLTLEKLHSIALLKLIGASNWVVLKLILQEALILGVSGYCIAYILGKKIFPNFPRRVILSNDDLFQLAIIVLIISVISSLLGVWKAMQVTPNEALN